MQHNQRQKQALITLQFLTKALDSRNDRVLLICVNSRITPGFQFVCNLFSRIKVLVINPPKISEATKFTQVTEADFDKLGKLNYFKGQLSLAGQQALHGNLVFVDNFSQFVVHECDLNILLRAAKTYEVIQQLAPVMFAAKFACPEMNQDIEKYMNAKHIDVFACSELPLLEDYCAGRFSFLDVATYLQPYGSPASAETLQIGCYDAAKPLREFSSNEYYAKLTLYNTKYRDDNLAAGIITDAAEKKFKFIGLRKALIVMSKRI